MKDARSSYPTSRRICKKTLWADDAGGGLGPAKERTRENQTMSPTICPTTAQPIQRRRKEKQTVVATDPTKESAAAESKRAKDRKEARI